VRLYLSSFRLGDRTDELVSLVYSPARALVVANAVDVYADEERRRQGVAREIAALRSLGFKASELDLRAYLEDHPRLLNVLACCQLLWVRSGNTFALRYLFARTHLDAALQRALAKDELVYGGYGAGVIVLQKSLRGAELIDDPHVVQRTYAAQPIWEGLGIIKYAVVPHFGSSNNAQAASLLRLAAYYRNANVPYRTLRDGEVIVVEQGVER